MPDKESEQKQEREGNVGRLRELVTIQSFRDPLEAMLAKAMLDSAGIECFLADDNTGRILGFASNVIGGIRMQVNRIDAEAAKTILTQPLPDAFDEAGEGRTNNNCAVQSATPSTLPGANSTNLCRILARGSAVLFLSTRGSVHASHAATNGTTRTTHRRLMKSVHVSGPKFDLVTFAYEESTVITAAYRIQTAQPLF